MKLVDIKEYELGEHCFGETLSVNGKDYDDLTKEEVMEFINDMCDQKTNINASILVRDLFKVALGHLQFDITDSHSDSCEQCGNWNHYAKYVSDVTEELSNNNKDVEI